MSERSTHNTDTLGRAVCQWQILPGPDSKSSIKSFNRLDNKGLAGGSAHALTWSLGFLNARSAPTQQIWATQAVISYLGPNVLAHSRICQ